MSLRTQELCRLEHKLLAGLTMSDRSKGRERLDEKQPLVLQVGGCAWGQPCKKAHTLQKLQVAATGGEED